MAKKKAYLVCSGCGGSGVSYELNIYDSSYKKEICCSECGGLGFRGNKTPKIVLKTTNPGFIEDKKF